MRKSIQDKLKEIIQPWHLRYRIKEYHEWSTYREEMQHYYTIEGALKIFPFIWFQVTNKQYAYFCKAYTVMKELRVIPKTKKRIIKESECVLRLLEEEDDE